MKTLLIAGSAGIALMAAVAVAQTPAAQAPAAGKAHSRAEVQAKVAKHFSRIDSDRDGFVTKAEADAGMAAHGSGGWRDHHPGKMFERLDSNRDGQVTRAEADAAMAAMAERHAGRDSARAGHHRGLFERLDSNRDGTVTRAEFDAARARHSSHAGKGGHGGRMGRFGGHMFGMADADKDGRVSLEEATAAALHHFDMADSNRDGQVTRDERRQMHQRMKAQHPQPPRG